MAYELRGDLEYALHAYWEASTLAEAAGVRYLVVNARCEAAMVRMAQGQLHQALQICHSVIGPMAPEDAAMAPPLGLAHAILGEVWREQNLLTKAEASLLTGIERSQAGGIIDDLRHEFLFLARLRSSQGEYVRAHAALQQIDVILQIYRVPRLSGIVEAHRVRIWLAERRPALAVRWAKAYAQRKATEYLCDFEELTLARVWLATARAGEAVALLERLLMEAETGQRAGCVIECNTLLALAHQEYGDEEAALASLRHALVLAAPEGYARIFLDEGQPMVALLRRAAGLGVAEQHAGQLLAMLARKDSGISQLPVSLPLAEGAKSDPAWIEPLTDREMEVLVLLARRFTNDEIARELVVSLPTVKTHAAHIYAKLGATGRQQAVSRARRLGILAT
jgi:LuxR family maltose regulon positive regulatory protein